MSGSKLLPQPGALLMSGAHIEAVLMSMDYAAARGHVDVGDLCHLKPS